MPVFTYGGRPKYPHCEEYTLKGAELTQGGYSQHILVDKSYVLHIPDNLPSCCAFTLRWNYHVFAIDSLWSSVSYVAGLGGLGHMVAKFGVAMGAHTTVISRGQSKKESALQDLKVHDDIDADDFMEMFEATGRFDFILSTISASHDVSAYLTLLKIDIKLIFVGIPPGKISLALHGVVNGRKIVAGSYIGGIRDTQNMLDFCGVNNIVSDVELIRADQVIEAYERVVKSDVKYRFVIDMDTL